MILSKISAFSVLLPSIVGAIAFYWLNKTLRKLSVFVLATLLLELVTVIFSGYQLNNMWAFHVYTFLEVIFIAWIYHDLLKNWRRTIVHVLFGGFMSFSILNILQFESLNEFNSDQRFVGGVVIIIYTLTYFVQIFQEAKIERLERHAYFWLNSSFLLYFTGTLFLFIFTKNILSSESSNFWNLHSILNILLNFGYAATLWMGAKKLI